MGTKHKLILLGAIFLCASAFGQQIQRKKLSASRINESLKIDGILNEPVYQNAEKATDFVQIMPYNGQPSYEPTEVQIFFDDNAIYVGAMLFDKPDSIKSYITTRDNTGVSDYFDIFIDPNNDGLTGYEFLVTPANSQTDCKAIKSSGGDYEDGSWDAVWQSATNINEKGWSVELKIPWSALRFPVKEDPVWGLNFFRNIRRYNSNNSWNFISREISGFIQQSGELHGLKNIKAPVRLSISPYIASYIERKSDSKKNDFLFKGGLDLKYGISESHTLDMMLIPDFGQIQSDDEQLNLSPYEIYYSEKRQFFVEGVELFNRAGIFYSRRIGGTPIFSDLSGKLDSNEITTYNPTQTQIINSTKISGRDKKGWGVGILNSMTLAGKAEITDTISGKTRTLITQQFSNYNVSVVEKALSNNSYISIINTNLALIGNPYLANVTGTEFQLKSKNQTYQVNGSGAFSYKNQADAKTGFMYNVGLRKIKGKFRFTLNRKVNSNTYDPNDMGYLRRNNDILNELYLGYSINNPFWIFKDWYSECHFSNTRLYKPNRYVQNTSYAWTSATFKNNWWTGLYFAYNFDCNDYYEPRVENHFYKAPKHIAGHIEFNTDQNKVISFYGYYTLYQGVIIKEFRGYYTTTGAWWKVNQRFGISYELMANKENNNKGYVNNFGNDSIFFGNYTRYTLQNVFSLQYNFNTKMSIDLRARHYWSWAKYNNYFMLNNDGSLTPASSCPTNGNVNYNAFNIDMTYKWEFAPGSQLSLVWKNAIETNTKNINMKLVENMKEMFGSVQTNSISIKLLYYIDINSLRKKG
jgi:hypothetical protein